MLQLRPKLTRSQTGFPLWRLAVLACITRKMLIALAAEDNNAGSDDGGGCVCSIANGHGNIATSINLNVFTG